MLAHEAMLIRKEEQPRFGIWERQKEPGGRVGEAVPWES